MSECASGAGRVPARIKFSHLQFDSTVYAWQGAQIALKGDNATMLFLRRLGAVCAAWFERAFARGIGQIVFEFHQPQQQRD
jgi:hypothetical protein